jgi:hypothetical protein
VRFILRAGSAGSKGNGRLQVGVVDVPVAVALVFRRHPEPAQRVKDLSSLSTRRENLQARLSNGEMLPSVRMAKEIKPEF